MDSNSSASAPQNSRNLTPEKSSDVRISVCVETGENQRHFEVHAPTFDDAYADLTRRLKRAGYRIAERTPVAGVAE